MRQYRGAAEVRTPLLSSTINDVKARHRVYYCDYMTETIIIINNIIFKNHDVGLFALKMKRSATVHLPQKVVPLLSPGFLTSRI